jgi:hypothetical protein
MAAGKARVWEEMMNNPSPQVQVAASAYTLSPKTWCLTLSTKVLQRKME